MLQSRKSVRFSVPQDEYLCKSSSQCYGWRKVPGPTPTCTATAPAITPPTSPPRSPSSPLSYFTVNCAHRQQALHFAHHISPRMAHECAKTSFELHMTTILSLAAPRGSIQRVLATAGLDTSARPARYPACTQLHHTHVPTRLPVRRTYHLPTGHTGGHSTARAPPQHIHTRPSKCDKCDKYAFSSAP